MMHQASMSLGAVLTGALVPLSCQSSPERKAEQSAPVVQRAPAKYRQQRHHFDTALIAWKAPDDWVRVKPTNSLRRASYRIGGVGPGGEAQLHVFHFVHGQGGTVKDNMERWKGQFTAVSAGAVALETRTVNGLRQHILTVAQGTFDASPAMAPKSVPGVPGQGLAAAIVEAPSGKYIFKMTGPSETVQRAQSAFLSLLGSVKPTDGEPD